MEENRNIILEKPSKGFKIALEIFRYLALAVYVLWTIFLVVSLLDAYNDSINRPENSIDPFPLAYAIFLVLSMIAYGAAVVLNVIGLIMSLINNTHKKRTFNIIYFLCAIVVVILSFVGLVLFAKTFN